MKRCGLWLLIASFFCIVSAEFLVAQENTTTTTVLVSQANTQFTSMPPASITSPSRVFAVNLWNAPIDLKLGADGVFVTSALSGNMASQMVVFRNFSPRSILYKASSADNWAETRQADGKVLNFAIQAGKTYLILVQSNGTPGLYELSASTESSKPKIAVFNATDQTLPSFQLGNGFNQGTVVAASSLSPAWTNFVDVNKGTYGAFWTYPIMPSGIAYFYTSGRDGKTLGLTNFTEGSWYVAVLWNDSVKNQSGGVIWDITDSH